MTFHITNTHSYSYVTNPYIRNLRYFDRVCSLRATAPPHFDSIGTTETKTVPDTMNVGLPPSHPCASPTRTYAPSRHCKGRATLKNNNISLFPCRFYARDTSSEPENSHTSSLIYVKDQNNQCATFRHTKGTLLLPFSHPNKHEF